MKMSLKKFFFGKRKKKLPTWEEGFIGELGTAKTIIPQEFKGDGLVLISREGQLFYFKAVTEGRSIQENEEVLFKEVKKTGFLVVPTSHENPTSLKETEEEMGKD